MSTTRIIYADLNKHQLTMYREDGSTIVIQQGDVRIAAIVAKVFPDMEAQKFCDLPDAMLDTTNHYRETEKKMNGFVRFFKVLKSKFDEIIGKHEEAAVELDRRSAGDRSALDKILFPNTTAQPVVTTTVSQQAKEAAESQKPLTKSAAAVADIMANAVASDHKSFNDADQPGQVTTTVAVLEDGTVIDNANKLEGQFKALNAGFASEQGMKNFLSRMASVKRAHSAQDLLTFMEKGELPIADDGSVLVYKRLRSTEEAGVYVDCHSRKVKQKVGSHVFMDEKLVDPSRHNECSNGLHVARRDYLRSFGGDICVLAKLAPEDVIAVPHGDARKLRAKGYHIIAVLTQEDHDNVVSDRPLKDASLLGNAIAGNHVGILQTVQITQQSGGGVIYTDVGNEEVKVFDENIKSESLDNLPQDANVTVDAVAVAKGTLFKAEPAGPVGEPLGEAEPVPAPVFDEAPVAKDKPKPVTKLDGLINAYKDAEPGSLSEHIAATELVAFKKAAKKSWTALGVPVHIFDAATALAAKPQPVPAPEKGVRDTFKAKGKPAVKTSTKKPRAELVKRVEDHKAGKAVVKSVDLSTKPAVKATRNIGPITKVADKPAETFWEAVEAGLKGDKAAAERAFAFKKAKKKGWTALGVTQTQLAKLEKALAGK